MITSIAIFINLSSINIAMIGTDEETIEIIFHRI
jgi:hypothetical protein